jgi:phosphohistidine phosphatase
MKRLTLIRHAKSSWDNPTLRDFDRPLNGRGRRDTPEMGRRLVRRGEAPGALISSPANRALTTAHGIAEALQFPISEVVEDSNLYHASSHDILAVAELFDDSWEHVMIFCHNPGITQCQYDLTGVHVDNIPTCGIAAIELDIDSWIDIAPDTGTLLYFDYPKLLN